MTTIISGFNSHFKEFMENVITIFPENRDLKKAQMGLNLIIKGNASMIIKFWCSYIIPKYGEKINEGDLEYFLEKNYSDDLQSTGGDSSILDSIEVLRQPIREMGESNKNKCLTYVRNLTKLATVYQESK